MASSPSALDHNIIFIVAVTHKDGGVNTRQGPQWTTLRRLSLSARSLCKVGKTGRLRSIISSDIQ